MSAIFDLLLPSEHGKMERMGTEETEFALYKALLQVLCEPTLLTTVGTALVAIGAYFSKSVKIVLRNIFKGLYRMLGGGELKDPDKLDDKKTEEKPAGSPHAVTPEFVQDASRIQNQLDELQGILDCSRVSILQFHNGVRFSMSNPVFRFSTSFEAISAGFAASSPKTRDMLVSINMTLVNPLMLTVPITIPGIKEEAFCKKNTEGCALVEVALRLVSYTRDDLKPGPVRLLMEELGMEKMYATLLSVPDKGPIGILTLQYHEMEGSDEIVAKNICEICRIKQYIQSLLYKA